MRNCIFHLTILAALVYPAAVFAQKPSASPAQGQSSEQQGTDDAQCLASAKQDTGIDPAAVASAPVPASGPQGERIRGAARGAVAADVIDGDADKGAAVGVVAGGRRARANQAAGAQQAQAQQGDAMHTYYQAYGACMSGRGYSVN